MTDRAKAALAELASDPSARVDDVARRHGMRPGNLRQYAHRRGISLRVGGRDRPRANGQNERNEQIRREAATGKPLAEIAREHRLSRQRVHQIVMYR